ncbi:MAG TPA: glycosyltransferase 87 family protein [Candidatus Limnocylindrales bacterium]|nr:glycosyltransferase 87 family protein [Candidatus Limnocylindrales bacterium]
MGILPRSPGGRRAGLDRTLVLSLALAAAGVLLTVLAVPILVGSRGWAFDFKPYLGAAQRISDGASPYLAINLAGPYTQGDQYYGYAPVFATLLVPLTNLGLDGAALVWLAFNLLFTALGCALLPVRTTVRLATFGVTTLSLAFLSDINLGSVNALLLCALVVAWRRPQGLAGGLALALSLSIRPYLATVLAGRALWRAWRSIAWTVLGGIVLIVLTAVVTGPGAFVDFLRVLGNVRFAGAPHNGALVGVADAFGLAGPVLTVVTVVAIVIALAAIVVAWRIGDPDLTFAVAVGASLLASPVIWDHYLMLLAIPAAFLAERGRWWALALPLLAWLPFEAYPLVALAGAWAPLAAAQRAGGSAAGEPGLTSNVARSSA